MTVDKKLLTVNVGKKLKEIRIDKGLQQADTGKALNTNANNVSNWEIGIALPPAYRLYQLCHFYGCSADMLLGLDSVPISDQELRMLFKYRAADAAGRDAAEAVLDAAARRIRSDG